MGHFNFWNLNRTDSKLACTVDILTLMFGLLANDCMENNLLGDSELRFKATSVG
jgi:hypothetical protein